jgi:diguanylate cyclase (GGDEF)-like protein
MYRQLEKLSITDALTGLFNRRLFDMRYVEEIHRARRNGTEISLLMIDIDDFKKINDTYGHLCGDAACSGWPPI